MIFFFPFNYLHVRGWLDIAEGPMIGIGVQQVKWDGDVEILTPVWHRDRALGVNIVFLWYGMAWYCPGLQFCVLSFPPMFVYLNVDDVPLLAVVESKLVLLGSESLVVVDQNLNLVTQSSQVNRWVFSVLVFHPTSRVKIYLLLGQLRMAVVNPTLTIE